MKKYNDLYTLEYEKMDKNCPLSEYPFPAFKRDSYLSLNGIWKHKITKNEYDIANINDDILVPFPIESKASLVQKKLNKGEFIIYKKEFSLKKSFIKDYTFLHFLGVDQQYYIIINGKRLEWITPLNFPTKIDIFFCIFPTKIKMIFCIIIILVKINIPFICFYYMQKLD